MPGTAKIEVTINRDQLKRDLREMIGSKVLVEGATVGRLIARHGCPNAQTAIETWSTTGLAKADTPRPCPTCDLARALIEGRAAPTVSGVLS